MTYATIAALVWAGFAVFTWALCRVAADADRRAEEGMNARQKEAA